MCHVHPLLVSKLLLLARCADPVAAHLAWHEGASRTPPHRPVPSIRCIFFYLSTDCDPLLLKTCLPRIQQSFHPKVLSLLCTWKVWTHKKLHIWLLLLSQSCFPLIYRIVLVPFVKKLPHILDLFYVNCKCHFVGDSEILHSLFHKELRRKCPLKKFPWFRQDSTPYWIKEFPAVSTFFSSHRNNLWKTLNQLKSEWLLEFTSV